MAGEPKSKMEWSKREMKRTTLFVGVFVVFLLFVGALWYFSSRSQRKSVPAETGTAAAFLTQTPTQASLLTPTQAPTPVPTIVYTLNDDEWVVIEVHDLDYGFRGVMHDTAIFQSKWGEQKEGMCAAPSWPQPDPGDVFVLNQWGVFIPLTEDPKHPTQRFIALDSLYE